MSYVICDLYLSVYMSDHNSWTPGPSCLKFGLGNLRKSQECSQPYVFWDSKLILWDPSDCGRKKLHQSIFFNQSINQSNKMGSTVKKKNPKKKKFGIGRRINLVCIWCCNKANSFNNSLKINFLREILFFMVIEF